MKKCRDFRNFLINFRQPKINSCAFKNTPEHSPRILEAAWKLPRHFREKSTFHENLDFFGVTKNLCLDVTLSKTHRQTQRMHSWIALGLRNVKKLVPCQTNSGILSYDHFSGQKVRKILGHSCRDLSLDPNYSKSREGSTSHFCNRFPHFFRSPN